MQKITFFIGVVCKGYVIIENSVRFPKPHRLTNFSSHCFSCHRCGYIFFLLLNCSSSLRSLAAICTSASLCLISCSLYYKTIVLITALLYHLQKNCVISVALQFTTTINYVNLSCNISGYNNKSRVAQWKRAGPITQRSVDRNHSLLAFFHNVQFPISAEPIHQNKSFPNTIKTFSHKN